MQFYLNGYGPGDPDVFAPAAGAGNRSAALPQTADVLVVGSGPAGVVPAAQLSMFPGIHTRFVERREGPLQLGQADGVACRTVEMFEAFGLSAKLIREACWVNETVFWRPSPEDRSRIVRTGRVQDVESTKSASASPTASTTCHPGRRHRGCRACSSPATPATRTARRPARA